MLGTAVNTATVLVGATAGLLVGDRLPRRVKDGVLKALGLITLWIGIDMVTTDARPVVIVVALIAGVIVGELFRLEQRLELLVDRFRNRVAKDSGGFTTGYVTASLLFCVGPMTLVGSITEGATGDAGLLLTKSVMDGFAAMALTTAYGIGVAFAAVTVLVVQGGLTLSAGFIGPLIDPEIIGSLTATGGLIILGLGIRILDLAHLRVVNFLPALVIVVPLVLWLP